MEPQTLKDMTDQGATEQEAQKALELFTLLRPSLKIKSNGRIETECGDKTVLGLYRTLKRFHRN
ncbi:hypothetical protein JWJ90_13205 [Desulfobulbus rhabdoformis]|uniref:hypothetical protein n=1 Tax=Desulfobulbus rhabdoformis TaxID=34032 RepID=UPI00196344C5|nr:hypothetical protein [Desulfobulbus rhabdoformis]MBM9615238.1 hypothetical protein [Desulfobulbus rhabdoformis]